MERLRELRNERKVNQKVVADYLGVDRTTYGKYETGDSEPNLDMLGKLATFFDVSIDYLAGRTDIKKIPSSGDEGIDRSIAMTEISRILSDSSPAFQEDALRFLRALIASDSQQSE